MSFARMPAPRADAIATEPGVAAARVEIFGHRGARGLAPENTIAGFKTALALGVDGLELDVGLTADGIAVVCHDPALNPDITRTTDGAWLAPPGPALRSMRFAELAGFDVGRIRPGTAYRARFRHQRGVAGALIPSLEDVLRLDPRARFLIELKTSPHHSSPATAPAELAGAVLRAAEAADALGRIAVISFDARGLHELRRGHPDIPLGLLTDTPGAAPAGIREAVPYAAIWGPNWRHLDARTVREAHMLGLHVVPWTVNARAAMLRLVSWGVDGLITDYPDKAIRAVRRAP